MAIFRLNGEPRHIAVYTCVSNVYPVTTCDLILTRGSVIFGT